MIYLLKMRKVSLFLVLIFILIAGIFYRLHWWPDELSFAYEQARDAVASQKIYQERKLTLIGPTTDIDGIYAGPLAYYFTGFFYHYFGKNPANIALPMILVNLSTILIIFFIGNKLLGRTVGILSALVFAFSFEVASYSLWLSNPPLSLPLIILAYYLVYLSFAKNQKFLPLAFLLTGLAVQSEIALITSLIPYFIIYLFYKKEKIQPRIIILSGLSLLVSLINFPVFEIRHKFLITNNLLKTIAVQESSKNLIDYLNLYLRGLAREFSLVLFPIHGFLAGVLTVSLLVYLYRKIKHSKKQNREPWAFITVWMLSTIFMFSVNAPFTTAEYVFIGVGAPIVLLFSSFVGELFKKTKTGAVIILLLVMAANFRAWTTYYPSPQNRILDSQRGMMLKDELAVIDYTYLQAAGKPFKVDTITSPLFVSPLWDYLYSWYGQEKFGYLPVKDADAEFSFLIVDPGRGSAFDKEKEKILNDFIQKTSPGVSNFGYFAVYRK